MYAALEDLSCAHRGALLRSNPEPFTALI